MMFFLRFLIVTLVIYFAYNLSIKQYFRNSNDKISYHILLYKFIHIINERNFFMNYGLWDDNTDNLLNANKNLIDFVFKKSEMEGKKKLNILDVGCGYGDQDIEWATKIDKSCKITAIDISEEQIYDALKKNSPVKFDICDATFIDLKYKDELFDRIISIESAFHYKERKNFFRNVNNLLEKDGKFIITDLMLNKLPSEDPVTWLFLRFFSDFLCIPEQNLISSDEWDKQISSELTVCESIDITDQTFQPYYKHFMTNYVKNTKWPEWTGSVLSKFLCSHQPFIYKVVVCTKKF